MPALLPWERLDDRSPLAARVAARTAHAIVEGTQEPGTWLTEADLASAEGVSRTPAREAMLSLESWGLVRLLPKKGAIVTLISDDERRDLLDLRAMFETHAVASVADRTENLLSLGRDLRPALERQREALSDSDLLRFAAGDYEFHAQIILSAGNAVISELLEAMGPRLARLTYLAVTGNPARLAQLLAEHESLARSAADGDITGFANLVRAHINAGHFSMSGSR